MTEVNDDELDDIIASEELRLSGNELMTKKELQNSRSRLRNWINRDAASSEKRARELAGQLLSQCDNDWHSRNMRDRRLMDQSIVSSVANLCNKVLESMQIRTIVEVKTINSRYAGRPITGWTDYEKIYINIDTSVFNINIVENVAELIHIIKGLVYHEGGHIMWTTPLLTVCKTSACPGNHFLNKDILNDYMQYVDNVDVVIGYLSAPVPNHVFHSAWNILEDQRMELAMVDTSPIMAKYFSTIVSKYAVDTSDPGKSWPWLAGRIYMPVDIRRAIRTEAYKRKQHPIILLIESTIRKYQRSNDPNEMHQAVIDMASCMAIWMDGNPTSGHPELDKHTGIIGTNGQTFKNIDLKDTPEIDPIDKTPDDGVNDRCDQEEGDRDGEKEKNSAKDKDKVDDPTAGDQGGEKSISEQLAELAGENIATMNQNEVFNFIGDVNAGRSGIAPRDTSLRDMHQTEISKSMDIRNSMLDTLDKLVTQVDPSWSFYQEDGVLDPTAYLTRDPGDMDFWSGMDGDSSNGHDLAVSLLIDTSGSMDGRIDRVSLITMGIRKACEHYNIPCTITTFSEEVKLVSFGDEEEMRFVRMDAGGGTKIFEAMTILDEQRCGKHYHLVVILTDGEWSDLRDVRLWGTPNRHIMIVGIGVSHEIIASKGANSAITITDVDQLAPLVTNALAGYFVG